MQSLIASLPGDGIGVEVIAEAVHVLRAVGARFGHDLRIEEAPVGGAGILACNEAFPAATRALCQRSDAILLGAIGDPRWSDMNAKIRPETALIDLRGGFGLYANIRPVRPHPALFASSPLKPEVLRDVDILFVRELTGGIYFGKKERTADAALDTCTYTVAEVERIVRVAGNQARQRRKKICSVDKNNVLATSKLWREVTTRVLKAEFPDVALEHLLVDAFAMHLLRRPRDFDVVVTENLFGDVLTDEASVLCSSLGMLPSASLGVNRPGLFEPVHGSAPDIAGKGISNPYGAILTAGMLLHHALGLDEEAQTIERAVERTLAAGVLTRDLGGNASTREVGRAVIAAL